MKSFVFALAAFALIVACWARPDEDTYTDKYDNVNLDDILANKRLLKNYFDCVMEKGKCTPDGTELKSHIVEAIQTKCAKCTEKQKKGAEKVIRHLVNNEAEWWKELTDKYDPEGKYRKEYEDEAKKYGIKVE